MMYESEYVQFGLELVGDIHFIHVDVLKKDKSTREEVNNTWIGLQDYLIGEGIFEVYAMIHEDDTKLKNFSSCYGFEKEYDLEDGYELWVGELI